LFAVGAALFDNLDRPPLVFTRPDDLVFSGATGFDRIPAVVVACPGRSIGLVKNSSTITTANNTVAGRIGYNAGSVRMAA
jgi:hypothetical protein